jgi:hypothetical protein
MPGGTDPAVSAKAEPAALVVPQAFDAPPSWHDPSWSDPSTAPAVIAEPTQVAIVTLRVPWSVRHAAARRRFFPVLSALLVAALVSTGAFLVVTTNSLNAQLTSTQNQLTSTKNQLTSTKNALDAAQANVTSLNGQLQQEASCISALKSDEATLTSALSNETSHFNSTAQGSDWATALSAYQSAMKAALSDLTYAYEDAAFGAVSAANTLASDAAAELDLAVAANTRMNSAVATINTDSNNLEAAISALTGEMTSTQGTCGV